MGANYSNTRIAKLALQTSVWSGRRDSNSRHSVWKTEALPAELHPRTLLNQRQQALTITTIPYISILKLRIENYGGGGRIRTFVL